MISSVMVQHVFLKITSLQNHTVKTKRFMGKLELGVYNTQKLYQWHTLKIWESNKNSVTVYRY